MWLPKAVAVSAPYKVESDTSQAQQCRLQQLMQAEVARMCSHAHVDMSAALTCVLLLLQIRFLSTPDPLDPVVKSHYRMMRSFTAGDPQPLVPGQALPAEGGCAGPFSVCSRRTMGGS